MMGQEHIRNIQLLPNTKIMGIYEPDEQMRQAASALAPSAIHVSSITELLSIDELDCLVIASPNYLHTKQLYEIAKQRPLPVLVEKPLSTDLQDAALIHDLMANYKPPIWVAMEYRYSPPLTKFIELANDTTGGVDMLSIREHRYPFLDKVGGWNRFNKQSGGTFVEKCCHFFDLMRLIIQSEPVSIMASASQRHNHIDEKLNGETPDILDSGYVIVNFKNGARAMLELCMFAEGSTFQEEFSAVGKQGKIECLMPGPSRFWPQHLGKEPTPKIVISPRHPKKPTEVEIPVDSRLLLAGDHHGSTFYQHQKFQQVVLGNGTPEVTLEDGWIAIVMGKAAQESSLNGRLVELDLLSGIS